MTEDEKDTEQRIFEAACRVFQRKGQFGARMQEIADEANINKSMLHYYYRSKDQLFQKVYQQKMGRFLKAIFKLWNADLPLDEKIEQLVDTFHSYLKANPKLPQFVVHEMNENPERFKDFIKKVKRKPPEKFHQQIKQEIEHGNIDDIDSQQLIISIVSLTHFPFISRTMVQTMGKMSDQEFDEFLNERREFLVNFILNGINYKKQ